KTSSTASFDAFRVYLLFTFLSTRLTLELIGFATDKAFLQCLKFITTMPTSICTHFHDIYQDVVFIDSMKTPKGILQ
ncbi:MAG TPA: hypothetical protein VFV16_06215, partial [Candidatus Nitrosotalea sp.]|nr:hypothetical protein [Candidatus Nitrosotalea sp.]